MNTLILTVGLPRSGKSTWAMQQGHPVVNPDSIRLALHGRPFAIEAEPMVWAIAYLMVLALFKAGHSTVVLDATNISEKRRDDWLSKDWQCRYVCFDTPAHVCIERARSLGQEELVPIIERMAADLTWPAQGPTREAPDRALVTFMHYKGDDAAGFLGIPYSYLGLGVTSGPDDGYRGISRVGVCGGTGFVAVSPGSPGPPEGEFCAGCAGCEPAGRR